VSEPTDDLRGALEQAYDAAFGPEPEFPTPDELADKINGPLDRGEDAGDLGDAAPEPVSEEAAADPEQAEPEKSLREELEAEAGRIFDPRREETEREKHRRKEIDDLLGDAKGHLLEGGKGRHHAVRLALQAHRRLIDEPLSATPELVAKIAGALSPGERAILRAKLHEVTGGGDAGSSDPALARLASQGVIARLQADAYRAENDRLQRHVTTFAAERSDFDGLKPVMMDVMKEALAAGRRMDLAAIYEAAKARAPAPAAKPPGKGKAAAKGGQSLRQDLRAAMEAEATRLGFEE